MQKLNHQQVQYAGFWRRSLAFSLDLLLISIITSALLTSLFGYDRLMQLPQASQLSPQDWGVLLLEQLLPALWTIGFWLLWMATPGKLLLDSQVLDADSLQRARPRQLIMRYFGYILSILPLGLGFIWIAFNKRKQGWHDKLSNTVVILQDDSLIKLESYT